MKILKQKGNVLLFAIVAMTAISVLGTGIYFMTTSAIFSGLGANQQNRAYQLAVAGKDYALIKNLPNATGKNFILANNDKFQLDISGDNIDSTGIVNEGTPYEAKRKISITKSGFSSQADISFAKDIAAFSPGIRQSQAGFVNVDEAAAQISLGQLQASKFGSVWYSGTSALGNCQDGECDFGTGFRTYFIFKLERQGSEIPHGFTFAIFNGADNSKTTAGGDYNMPELLAYAGDSCKSRFFGICTGYVDPNPDLSKKGIQAPKMAIEFDASEQSCGDVCNQISRCDGSRNHLSYTFWGDQTTPCKIESSFTYDDNKHGVVGAATDPVNAVSTDASDTSDYYVGLSPFGSGDNNWLFSTTKVYAVRIEVTRASTMNTNSKYFYTINTWIKRCSSDNISDLTACSEFAGLSNTKVSYNPNPADSPTLKRTIELGPTHSKFNKFLFGWTAAADSVNRENLTLRNFQMYFAREPVACGGYGVWNNLEGPGATRYFNINGIGCTGILNGSLIGNIGPNGTIKGYTNSACLPANATSPSSISYDQAVSADTNKNCAVNFSGTDK
jgi:hypothetical protein